jgi:hypothetical protein
MEDEVRNLLSSRGNVQEADLAEGNDGNMTGHATVAAASGQSTRYNCSATKTGEGTRYNINCVPAIDEAMLQAIEGDIRRTYEQRGAQIVEVDMQKQGEDNMRGHLVARDEMGNQARLNCTARRNTADNQFPWECVPEGEAATGGGGNAGGQAAPAGGKPGAGGDVASEEQIDGEGGK